MTYVYVWCALLRDFIVTDGTTRDTGGRLQRDGAGCALKSS